MNNTAEVISLAEYTSRVIILSLPAAIGTLKKGVSAPYAQWELIQQVRQETRTARQADKEVVMEYIAIGEALEEMGIPFFVAAHPDTSTLMRDFFALQGNCIMRTVQSAEKIHQLYPRDYATYINDQLVLVQPGFTGVCPSIGMTVVESPYATGGRIHHRGGKAFINPIPYAKTDPTVAGVLLKAGLRVFSLPNALMVNEDEKGQQTIDTDDHVDRVSGLIEATDGSLHLITEDTVVGINDRNNPQNPVHTLSWYQKTCDVAKITLHVLSGVKTPAAMCFWQAPEGQVLVTSGEPKLTDLLQQLVGSDQVFVTKQPIRHYPTWLGAGIRCLIGEVPEWMLGPPHVPITQTAHNP